MSSTVPLFPYARGPAAFVLDVWVPLAWLVPARGNSYTSGVVSWMSSTTVAVPHPWPILFAEACRSEEAAGTVSPARVDYFLHAIQTFSVVYDATLDTPTCGRIIGISRSSVIPVGAAAFLELALRLNIPLATIDPSLSAAAAALNIPLFTP